MAEVRVLGRYFVELTHNQEVLIVDLEDLLHVHRVRAALDSYAQFLELSVDRHTGAVVFPDGGQVPWAEVEAIAKPARPNARLASGDQELDLRLTSGCHQ